MIRNGVERRVEKLEKALAPEQKMVVVMPDDDFDEVVKRNLEPGMTVDDLTILRVVYDRAKTSNENDIV